MKTVWGLILFALAQTLPAASLTGLLDPSFEANLGSGFVWKMAAQQDGKIVILGDFQTVNGAPRAGMARLTADGILDPSFTTDAIINPLWTVNNIGIAPDNKVILAGTLTNYGSRPVNGIVRLNADGSFDSTFHPQERPVDEIFALAYQSDGKLLVGGTYLVRLLNDGSVDPNFNFPGVSSTIYSLAVQPDGKILVGAFNAVHRLNANGSLDATFENSFRPSGGARQIVAAPDGGVILGGFSDFTFNRKTTSVIRLKSDGSFDPTFSSPIHGGVFALLLDHKQRVLVSADSERQYGLFARLEPDGSRDLTFELETAGKINRVYEAIVQSDNRIIVHKDLFDVDGVTYTNSLARLNETNATSVIYIDNNHFYPLESATNVTITVRRSGNIEAPLTVAYRTQDDTARAGVDYTATEGALLFSPGEAAKDIAIQLIDDPARASTPQVLFTVNFSIISGNGILHPDETPAFVHVREADVLTTVEFVSPTYEYNESRGSAEALVRRPNPFAFNGNVLVDYHTEDITAHAGTDYTATSGTLRFSGYQGARGVQDRLGVAIPIFPNDTMTGPRKFRIVLSNPRTEHWDGPPYYDPIRVVAEVGNLPSTEVTIVDDRLQIDTALHVWMTSQLSVSYVLERSTNMRDWVPVYTNSATWKPAYVPPQQGRAEFYRAIVTR